MSAGPAAVPVPPEEARLLARLRQGEEAAFLEIVQRYHPLMQRLVGFYVSNRAVAEEVVQETWVGVLQGLDRFEGRSSLKTWICSILVNRAKTRAQRESRMVPLSALQNPDLEGTDLGVESDRFLGPDAQWPDHWAAPPRSWGEDPEKLLLARETQHHIQEAIDVLPEAQRTVITLRDVKGWTSEEVCNVLGVSETNQRVLLHRARSKVRRALEDYF